MSSNNKSEEGDLASLLSRAVEDLWSQAGRIGPDIKAVQGVAMTALAGGIVDDHKYIVGDIRVEVPSSTADFILLDRKCRASSSISP